MNKPNEQRSSRRRALASAAMATATSPIWIKPVVSAVVLPNHAQTTSAAIAIPTLAPGVQVVVEIIVPDLLASKQPHKH